MEKRKTTMTREQAMELYEDLERSMAALVGKEGMPAAAQKAVKKPVAPRGRSAAQLTPQQIAQQIAKVKQQQAQQLSAGALAPQLSESSHSRSGRIWAVSILAFFALSKVTFSALEASGVLRVESAQASIASVQMMPVLPAQKFSKEEIKILTALDERRAQLEERSRKLEDRERDIDQRDQEFAARLQQLRDLTNSLKTNRDKDDHKRNTQLEQLANVYGSMEPKEAASLIEQLDITISLALLQKMPEKRIAQILALMSPERALSITKMLSGRI